jgi:hypothetical protein
MGVLDAPGVSFTTWRQQRARELRAVGKPVLSGAADPDPSVTLGSANGASAITNNQYTDYATKPSVFRMRGGTVGTGTHGGFTMAKITAPTDPPSASVPFSAEFAVTGTQCEIRLAPFGTTMNYRVWVDGRVIPGAKLAGARQSSVSADAAYLLLLDWSGTAAPAGKRVVRIELSGAAFGGVVAARENRVSAPAESQKLIRSAWVGDSFLEGTNADTIFSGIAYTAAPLLGWDEIILAAQGGTGYLNASAVSGRGTFRSRVADVVAQDPHHVVVAGGYNDIGVYTAEQTGAEAALYFQALRAGCPTAKIWVVGPWSLFGPTGATQLAFGAQIRTAVEAVSGTYLDMYTDPWITGTGSVAAPPSPLNGNAGIYVTSGGDPHPSPAGHQFYGYEFAAAIASQFTP